MINRRMGLLGFLLVAAWLCWASVGQAAALQHATLGGGCFWAMQAEFEQLKGVQSAVPGYAGGKTANPSYEQVCSGGTGHAEVIRVTFDPAVISYDKLLHVFFGAHDPTTRDRQGPDVGPNYRSLILTESPAQAKAAHAAIAELTRTHAFNAPIVTEVAPLTHFYRAEDYHQHYYALHPTQPYCAAVVSAEVARFRGRFGALLKH